LLPVAERLAALRAHRGAAAADLVDDVRDLVVVCSSSRGGSSLFGELLRASPDLLTFSAEINPHVTIPVLGMGPDLIADPSPVCAAGPGRDVLAAELALDLGRQQQALTWDGVDDLADHTAWRLTMQWPDQDIDPLAVHSWVVTALRALESEGAWSSGGALPREAFFLALLPMVCAAHPGVDPRRYDLDVAHLDGSPAGPHANPVVEMAPFVLPRAWQRATPAEARSMPVVVTTPRNAFRLPLLASVFRNARVRVVHLTRNPAASVNGLRDGWLHHGFFTCDVGFDMSIEGHTWPRWWCYDMPPDWRAWTSASLVDVCAFQWRAAHTCAQAAAEAMSLQRYAVRFEDVIGDSDRRSTTLTELAEWIGVDAEPIVAAAQGSLPVVMPTEAPRPARWRRNADLLEPVLRDEQTLDVAAGLGYGRDAANWT
jgi:hypothetical protein